MAQTQSRRFFDGAQVEIGSLPLEAQGGLSALIGQVTETDTALAVTRVKTKTIGQVVETDTAQPVTGVSGGQVVEIGLVTETDTAQAVTRRKTKTIGQTTETDTAQAATRRKTKTIGQITETDTAQAATRRKTKTIGQITETDTAQAVTRRKTKTIDQAIGSQFDIEASDTFNRADSTNLGANWVEQGTPLEIESNYLENFDGSAAGFATWATELSSTDQFIEFTVVNYGTVAAKSIRMAVRCNDTSPGVGTNTYYDVGWDNIDKWTLTKFVSNVRTTLDSDTSTPTGPDTWRLQVVGSVLEFYLNGDLFLSAVDTDITSGGYVHVRIDSLNSAVDDFSAGVFEVGSERAQAVTRRKTKTIGQVLETDTAQPVTARSPIGLVTETDTAQAATRRKTKTIGQTTETDTAQAVTSRKTKTIGQITETDTAQAVTSRKTKTIGQTTETDTAQAATRRKTKTIGQVLETDTAQAVTSRKTKTIGQTTETDTAQAATRRKTKTIGQVLETDTAQPVTAIGGGNNEQVAEVGQVVESDSTFPVAHRKTKTVGQVSESGIALPVSARKTASVGQAVEIGIALPLARRLAIGVVTEAEQAFPVIAVRSKSIGFASELDSALPVTVLRQVPRRGSADIIVYEPSVSEFSVLQSVGTTVVSDQQVSVVAVDSAPATSAVRRTSNSKVVIRPDETVTVVSSGM
jgi:hypothetical protein